MTPFHYLTIVPEKDAANFQETFRRIGERFAVEVFHDEEVEVILMTTSCNVHLDELRDRARLAIESLAELRVRCERLRKNLDRIEAIEAGINRR